MLDPLLERVLAPLLNGIADRFPAAAKGLDVIAFCMALFAAVLIARHHVLIGLAVFALALLVGGVAARGERAAASEVFAAIAFAAVPVAFVLDAPVRALPAVVLMFGLAANAAARLKFAPTLIGSAELLIVFVLAAVFPAWFGVIAYCSGVLCFAAAGVRIAASRRM